MTDQQLTIHEQDVRAGANLRHFLLRLEDLGIDTTSKTELILHADDLACLYVLPRCSCDGCDAIVDGPTIADQVVERLIEGIPTT